MKTIFTAGVFDMLHIGHISLFKKAKALGDRLVVAVQDDEHVLKYKPNENLVYDENERLFMVSSVRFVDSVVTYSDVDIAVKNNDFDVFAVGPDQNHQGFQEAMAWCKQNGKEVVVIPRTEEISSTLLKEYSKYK